MSRVSSDLDRALLLTVHRTCRRGGRSFKRSTGIANVLRRTGLATSSITWHFCNESSFFGSELAIGRRSVNHSDLFFHSCSLYSAIRIAALALKHGRFKLHFQRLRSPVIVMWE